ncbi:hypothetical protein DMH27_14065 [Raoultella planticola]|nr:hypothetical protein [Raoultella planticola]
MKYLPMYFCFPFMPQDCSTLKAEHIAFALILLEPFLASRILFPWVIPNPEVDFLSPCFAFGAIMALNREIIEIKLSHCLGFATLYYILQGTVYSPYFAYASIFFFRYSIFRRIK